MGLKRVNKPVAAAALCFFSLALCNLLLAEATASGTFSLTLKEWLVLEINTGITSKAEAGRGRLVMDTEITTGQIIEIKAILSAGHHRMSVLKAIVFSSEDNFSEVFQWIGMGDVSGSGFLKTNQEFVLAAWQDQGTRDGKLILLSSEGQDVKTYRVAFVLSSL